MHGENLKPTQNDGIALCKIVICIYFQFHQNLN